MNFQEQFPSLKNRLCTGSVCESPFSECLGIAYFSNSSGEWVHKYALQEFCLDKQKVREAIREIIDEYGCIVGNDEYWTDFEIILKQRLGL